MEKIINRIINIKMAIILFLFVKIFRINIVIDEYGNSKKFNLLLKYSKKIKYYSLDFWINDAEIIEYEYFDSNNNSNLIFFNYPIDLNQFKRILVGKRHIYIKKNKKIKLKF